MVAWWAPLGAGVRRLLGGEAPTDASTSAPPASAAPVGLERPPQAWPWQPPVQRVVDPGWAPALRPDDFAGGLASHQDPSLRRDLVHDVRPAAGGLVDGLADLVPGGPTTWSGSGELPVRPVRHEAAAVQRSLAGFATDGWSDVTAAGDGGAGPVGPGAADRLATVALQPPWSAEAATQTSVEAPVERAAAVVAPPPGTPAAALPVVAREAAAPVASRPSVPVGTRDVRDVRVQLTAEPAGPGSAEQTIGAASASTASPVGSTGVLPVVRSLPTTEAPPPRPAPATDLPVAARALPAVQRRAVEPASAGPGPAAEVAAALPHAAGVAEPATGEAPLSGFAEAIQRLAVDEGGHAEIREPASEPVTPELALPSRPAARAGTSATSGTGPDVQRRETRSAERSPGPEVAEPAAAPAASAAATSASVPLLGAGPVVARTQGPSPSEAPPPEDLAGLPVLRPSRPASPSGTLAVPHLAAVPSLSAAASPSVEPATGSSGAVVAGPVVARTLAAADAPQRPAPSPSSSAAVDAGVATSTSAPLAGLRTALVQRADAGLPSSAARAADPVVQPLRFGGPGAQPGQVQRTGAAAEPLSSLSRTSSPQPSTGDVARSVQRTPAVPAVAPGLVGPAPVLTELLPGPEASDAGDVPMVPVGWSIPGAPAVGSAGEPGLVPGGRATEGPVLQRLPVATPPVRPPSPTAASPAGLPVPVRSLPFDAMFGPGAYAADHAGTAADTAGEEDGWTSVDLPVLDGVGVQRAVETDPVSVEPTPPSPAPEPPAPAPAAPPPTAPIAAAAPAAGSAAPSGADLDEMARRLFDPLSARLRAELLLDRERAGLVADARF